MTNKITPEWLIDLMLKNADGKTLPKDLKNFDIKPEHRMSDVGMDSAGFVNFMVVLDEAVQEVTGGDVDASEAFVDMRIHHSIAEVTAILSRVIEGETAD